MKRGKIEMGDGTNAVFAILSYYPASLSQIVTADTWPRSRGYQTTDVSRFVRSLKGGSPNGQMDQKKSSRKISLELFYFFIPATF